MNDRNTYTCLCDMLLKWEKIAFFSFVYIASVYAGIRITWYTEPLNRFLFLFYLYSSCSLLCTS